MKRILAIDPSMNATGLVLFDVEKRKVISVETIEMPKSKKKRKGVPVYQIQTEKRSYVISALKRYVNRADIIYSEHPIGTQSAAAASSLGTIIGIVHAMAETLDIDIYFFSQRESKLNFIGSESDDPQMMLSVAIARYGSEWASQHLLNSKVRWEAVADAMAILDLGLKYHHKQVHTLIKSVASTQVATGI